MATRTRRLGVEVIDPARLRAALDHAEVSQASVCRELEIDAKTLNNWITGRTPLYRMPWYAITAALELPKDWEPPAPPDEPGA